MWLLYPVMFFCWYHGYHSWILTNPYVENVLNQYVLPVYEKYLLDWHMWAACYAHHYSVLLTPWIDMAHQRFELFYNFARIAYLDWLGVCGFEDSKTPGIKWFWYTWMGQKFKMPVRRFRGPSVVDPDIENFFGPEVRGPHGDYHGQQELLRMMLATEDRHVSLDQLIRTTPFSS